MMSLKLLLPMGALSVALSGAGPTVAAYCLEHAEQVAKQMQNAFNKYQIACNIKILKSDADGAEVHTSHPRPSV